ncbi:hypothetical protein JRQ81_007333 [Phrynocephalus forsythii]|uniref:Uncharacterized protein n=1 Tax=Phrynocephalus forsythii TaxID=171643 RepID=A0A9Q1ATJ0_9SAUR|nr:hypothetical protein JRQ81_007333 [Phrynocephalus forsythii]
MREEQAHGADEQKDLLCSKQTETTLEPLSAGGHLSGRRTQASHSLHWQEELPPRLLLGSHPSALLICWQGVKVPMFIRQGRVSGKAEPVLLRVLQGPWTAATFLVKIGKPATTGLGRTCKGMEVHGSGNRESWRLASE